MAKKSTIKRALALLQFSKLKKESLLPYSKASSDNSEIAFADKHYFQKTKGKKELEVLYRNSWICHRAAQIRANLLVSRGLKIVCRSEKAKSIVDTFLKNMHPTRPMLALQNTFWLRSINTDVFGFSTEELLYTPAGTPEKPVSVSKATDLIGTIPIHPINIDFQRSQNGEIDFDINHIPKGWVFNRDPEGASDQGIPLEFDRVACFTYNLIGDELLGMSLFEPIYKTAERLMKIEEGITNGILIHGNPLKDIIVGDEAHPPTKPMIDQVAEQTANLNNMSVYVHPGWIRVAQMESFSLGKSPDYTQPFITAIAAASGIPEFILLGRGEGTNKATAQAMINFIHQTIEPLQQAHAMFFEEKILAPLMKLNEVEEVPTIEWNEILPRDPTELAEAIQKLSSTLIGDEQILNIEEARELAGLGKSISYKMETEKSQLSIKREHPGIYLTEPHGELIWKGQKKLIIKSKDFSDMTMIPLYLVSDKKAYGVIKLRRPEEINLTQFLELEDKHKITEKERRKWWGNIDKFYSYKFNVLEMFEVPKDYTPQQGVQSFIKNVEFQPK